MSVTIRIENGQEYAREHAPTMIRTEQVECMCVDAYLKPEPDADCPFCGGKGTYPLDHFPWELNLANGNFETFWSALGLTPGTEDTGLTGFIDGRRLSAALRSCVPELAVRGGSTEGGAGTGKVRWIDCGLRLDQVERYLRELATIADEAARREERVEWI